MSVREANVGPLALTVGPDSIDEGHICSPPEFGLLILHKPDREPIKS